MFCRKCGNEIPDESLFCNKCGIEIITTPEKDNVVTPLENNTENMEHNNDNIYASIHDQHGQKQKIKIPKPVIISVIIVAFILGGIWYNAHLNSSLNEAKSLYTSGKYRDAESKLDGLVFIRGNKEADKIRLSGDIGWYYQSYEDEINPQYDWDNVDYARAVELLFDGLDFCLIKEKVEKADWQKEIIDTFKEKYYSELNYKFDISKITVDEILNLNYDEKAKRIEEIANKVKGEKEMLDYNRNNPVEFRNLSWDSNSSYTIATGQVYNKSDRTIKFVTIKVAFKDKNGNVLDTDSTYAVGSEGLAPGESSKWRASVVSDSSIDSYSVSLVDFE